MAWNPIVVGVDGTSESACAAALGDYIARRTGAACHLVHAAQDFASAITMPEVGDPGIQALAEEALASARQRIELSLGGPRNRRRPIDVRMGRPSVVLTDVAGLYHAEAVVLGSKHRSALARLAGSTIPHLIRRGTVPVLATDRVEPHIQRVLAAVDLSWAAGPTIAVAQRWAAAFGASLRVLHTVEPAPVVAGMSPSIGNELFFRTTRESAERALGPMLTHPGAELVVRRGLAAAGITTETMQWHADLVVVGSHGKGWVDRLLIGSTSERLLHILPAPLLVVPVAQVATAQPVPDAVGVQASA